MGASPGGWTWVLCKLKAKVLAIDKAPIDINLSNLFDLNKDLVEFRKQDIFNLKWEEFLEIDWLFCDVICYPKKLYDFLSETISKGRVKNFVCTIKFQGDTDFEIIKKFESIPNSRLFHLYSNKHELTWVKLDDNK